jgi:hypothetical protein
MTMNVVIPTQIPTMVPVPMPLVELGSVDAVVEVPEPEA